jgi:hypothetical protein
MSTADHPQTDGQTEIMNQYIDQRLRPFVNYYQDNWPQMLPMIDFAQATLPSEATGFSPFEIERGCNPRTSFDWDRPDNLHKPVTPKDKLSMEQAKQYVERLEDVWTRARKNMLETQERYRQQANKRRREVDWEVGDMVYVKTKSWKIERPSRKLAHVMAGPYKVLEKKGHSYLIDFPPHIKVHPVIPPERIRKAAADPLPGQFVDPDPPTAAVDGVDEWEVDEIVASRLHYGKLQYRICWKGHDLDNQWYYAEDVRYCPHKVQAFHKANPEAAGPPKRLADWLERWEEGDDTYEFDDDNYPMGASRGRPPKATSILRRSTRLGRP